MSPTGSMTTSPIRWTSAASASSRSPIYEINDSPHFNNRNGTIDEFEKMIRRQFDTLYEEGAQSGRVMAICLHPYLIGVPHRIAGLDSVLKYIRSHAGVWFATGEEIVRHWLQSGATF